ncbi:MAG: glycosyltransferase [Flavobacteriaceae bacterium]|nr:glycosyltransferase [Flavobacteriaceae bacterium]
MRILLVTSNFYLAEGAIAKGIVKALDKDEVFFFSVHDFKYRFKEFIDLSNKVDVIHWLFNVGNLNEKYTNYFRNSPAPNIATVHHVCQDEMYKIEEASYANVIHVVSIEWLKYLQCFTQKPVLLANLGIDIGKFKELQTTLYSGQGILKIGMMGFYPGKNNRKRIDIAIEVFKNLIEKKIAIELVIQGGGWEKYYKEFDEIGLKFNHSKLESDAKIVLFFEKVHIYLCSSDIEGGPFPVLEAMASGIPVISTKVGLADDLLKQGGGLLCEKRDVKSLTEAVIKVKNNNKLYKRFSNEAKVIAENYDWFQLNKEFSKLYTETIISWEEHNATKWEYQKKDIIKAEEQRITEQLYNNIHQVRSLLHNKNFKEGIKLMTKILFSKKIDFYRKSNLLKESISFFIRR